MIALVVERYRVTREMFALFLSQQGWTVIKAQNGLEALRAFLSLIESGHDVHLLITELEVGGLRADELLRFMKSMKPNTALRAVLCDSGYDDKMMKNPDRHGFPFALWKPFGYAKFMRAIDILFPAELYPQLKRAKIAA